MRVSCGDLTDSSYTVDSKVVRLNKAKLCPSFSMLYISSIEGFGQIGLIVADIHLSYTFDVAMIEVMIG